MIHDAVELFIQLQKEDDGEYFYRGQTKEFPAPLWPSAYRPFTHSNIPFNLPKEMLLRGSEGKFYNKTGHIGNPGYESEAEYNSYVKDFILREYIKKQMRNVLGYPASEAFFQQTGLQSEGLDVTRNLAVAFFFASHELRENLYFPKTGTMPSVIYRWKISQKPWRLPDLNAYDYETCPILIPTKQIFELFELCENKEEFLDSLDEYREKINWNLWEFDLESIKGKRPFETIKIPYKAFASSRVINQDACILLPDAAISVASSVRYLAEFYEEDPDNIIPSIFVSDQSTYCECEKFNFSPNRVNQIQEVNSIIPERMFPNDDILFILLRGWLRTFFMLPPTVPSSVLAVPSFYLDEHLMKLGIYNLHEIMAKVASNLENRYFL